MSTLKSSGYLNVYTGSIELIAISDMGDCEWKLFVDGEKIPLDKANRVVVEMGINEVSKVTVEYVAKECLPKLKDE